MTFISINLFTVAFYIGTMIYLIGLISSIGTVYAEQSLPVTLSSEPANVSRRPDS